MISNNFNRMVKWPMSGWYMSARRDASTLALVEQTETLSVSSLRFLSAAAQMEDSSVDLLVTGGQAQAVADKLLQQLPSALNIKRLLICDQKALDGGLPERMAPFLRDLMQKENYKCLMAAHTAWGKNIVPRVGALLDVQPITDILKILPSKTYLRPIYAGNALATVRSLDDIQLLTLRPTAFDPFKPTDKLGIRAEKIQVAPSSQDATMSMSAIKEDGSSSSSAGGKDVKGADLASAKYVIAGGRGLKSGENFKLLEDLADALGRHQTAVGASRAAVDAGFVPNDRQIGQTGKIVAPELYIAVGISGAIQHLAGMKDSKIIVAINKDGDSPIFQIADYGLVDDIFKAVPELTKVLKSK